MDKIIDSNSRNGDTSEAGNELPESKDGLDRRAFLKSAVAAAGGRVRRRARCCGR